MAKLGLLSREFTASTLEANLDAMLSAGASASQFDLCSAVGTTFPATLSDQDIALIRKGFEQRKIELSALSGTYNMIDPDPKKREWGARDLDRLIGFAPRLGTRIVTLCTGSRDPENMWQQHPDNDTKEAWADLVVQVERAVRTAESYDIALGVETEVSNTINTVRKARRLLDEIGSRHLKIIMDGANLFKKGQLARMHEVIDEAFDLLGSDIVLAHAKDLDQDGEAGHVAAGYGKLDYPYYMKALRGSGFDGTIVLHALRPEQAADRIAFVRQAAPAGYV